jgi:2-polyprenyl-6-methoxyphenol hydroxylase-like FAD-dependent oxidoreductase
MRHLRIGIVGGSIAGCATSIELARSGHDVTIFERSTGTLVGRGAGIGTPVTLFNKLVDRDLVDGDMPRLTSADHPLVGRTDDHSPLGHTALTLGLDMALCNWGDLYQNLRKRVPDSRYKRGVGVEAVLEHVRARPSLELSDGSSQEFDLVAFADGYQSLGREHLFPSAKPQYRGYILWRGVLDEQHLDDSSPLESALYRIHYKGLPGNAVFYFVPGTGGSIEEGHRWVNWACYIPVPEDDLARFLTDRDNRQHSTSLPPGSMRPEEEQRLTDLMIHHLPPYFAEIVSASSNTFAQPIYTVDVKSYYQNRYCLVGDAGSVAPPFTGSGVFKAVNNAVDLVLALGDVADIDDSLQAWSSSQVAASNRISVLGRQMEKAFVWDAPDFAVMSEQSARSWWNQAITFPDDFSYVQSSVD